MPKKFHIFLIILFSVFIAISLGLVIFLTYRVTNLDALPEYYNLGYYLYAIVLDIFMVIVLLISIVALILLSVFYKKRKQFTC